VTAIAERAGFCAVYVRNLLFLLRLHPAILAAIENLGPGEGEECDRAVAEADHTMPHARQLAVAGERLKLAVGQECG
jgi:hypothetical protein